MVRRTALAPLLLVLVSLAACSGGGGSAPTSSGGTALPGVTDGDPGDEVDAATETAIAEHLSLAPVAAELGFAPAGGVAADVTAAAGGTATLTFPDGATARLDVPPGALATDLTLTLVPVTSLGGDGRSFAGVEILPSGLVFPDTALPTITFTGTVADHAVAWDADGDLERTVARDDAGSVVVPLFHTSGAGVGAGAAPLPASEVDVVIDDVRRRLADADAAGTPEAYEDARADALSQLENLAKGYQRAALKIAARQCHALEPVHDDRRIRNLITALGGTAPDNDDLVGVVLVASARCAIAECDEADPGAAARFLTAFDLISAGIGTVDAATADELADVVPNGRLLGCAQFDVTVAGRLTLTGELAVREGFLARGNVAAGPTPGLLNLVVSASGWEQITENFLNGLGEMGQTYLGVEFPDGFVDCDEPDYEPGAMSARVEVVPGLEPNTVLPALTIAPYLPDTLVVCNGQTDPTLVANDPLSLVGLPALPRMQFDGTAVTYYLSEANEVGLYSWRVVLTADTAALGSPGTMTVEIQIRASRSTSAGTPTSTDGMSNLLVEYWAD